MCTRSSAGNPEPSQRYTVGRCRDYLRGKVPLITGWSVPHPNDEIVAYAISGEGDEIVRTPPKDGDNVNPLVPGSSPGGPTKSSNHLSDLKNLTEYLKRSLSVNWVSPRSGY